MRKAIFAMFVAAGLSFCSVLAFGQEIGGDDRTGPYNVVENWPQPLPDKGYIWGSTGGIFAETPNKIFIANRGEQKLPDVLPRNFSGYWGSIGNATGQTPVFKDCIDIVDASGKLVEAWTQWDRLFEDGRGPHSVLISPYDPEHNVWVVDDIHQQIFKFTNDGKKLLMVLGVRDEAGNDDKHFKRPTDIAWLPDGTFFISDGYGNTRFVKFDKDGKYLAAWGTPGTGNSQFNTPHSITVDKNRRVYVADRANNRIQVFDENGKYLSQIPNVTQPYHIRVSNDQYLWVFAGPLDKVVKYDLTGHLLYGWGSHGTTPGLFWAVHQFSGDSDGNLYTAEVFGGRPQKFQRRPGADPTHFYEPVPLMAKKMSNTPPMDDSTLISRALVSPYPAMQGSANFSGTWKLAQMDPAMDPRTGRPTNAGGGAAADPYGQAIQAVFGQAPPNVVITQTATNVSVQIGSEKETYTVDNKLTVAPPDDINALKTWAHWDGPNKLHLHYKRGMNWARDIMTLDGGNLTVVRDIETNGGSFVHTLTYKKGM